MKTWSGEININESLAKVTVYINEPSGYKSGSWHGVGTLDKAIGCEQYETEIGTIIITKLQIGGSGISFSFTGSGRPKINV